LEGRKKPKDFKRDFLQSITENDPHIEDDRCQTPRAKKSGSTRRKETLETPSDNEA